MKADASTRWRATGDYAAFAHVQWEFQSQLYLAAARRLKQEYEAYIQKAPFEGVAYLVVAQFNICLAAELICKARYLKAGEGPREAIYTHQVLKLIPANLLSPEQKELLNFASQIVEWAGRYPTPRWDKESSREKYDISAKNGQDSFDANEIPNRASVSMITALEALYAYICETWAA